MVAQAVDESPPNGLLERAAPYRTAGGLQLPDIMADQELAALIAAIGLTHDADQWATGDLALYWRDHRCGGSIPGEELARLAQFLKVGSAKTLYNRMVYSSIWPMEDRVIGLPKISYSHHVVLCGLRRDKRVELINFAAVEGLSVSELHKIAIGIYQEGERNPPPAYLADPPPNFWTPLNQAQVFVTTPRPDRVVITTATGISYEITAVSHRSVPVLDYKVNKFIP